MKHSAKLIAKKRLNRKRILIFTALVALAGVVAIITSFAAVITTIQAENINFSRKAIGYDPAKKAIASLYWNASGSTQVTLPTNTTNLTIVAKGTRCNGSPIMTVQIDGEQVASMPVSVNAWRNYSIPLNLQPGTYIVSVSFNNDYVRGGTSPCDRNLFLDTLNFTGNDPTPKVTTPLQGESLTYAPGKASIGTGPTREEKALSMWSNGMAQGQLNLAGSSNRLTAYIRGDQCDGAPFMTLYVDGKQVVAKHVRFNNWGQISAPVAVGSGQHTVAVGFTNDYGRLNSTGSFICDRNLHVDKLVFEGPMPVQPPVQVLPTAPTGLKVLKYENGSVTLQATVDANTATAGVGYTVNGQAGPPVADAVRMGSVVTMTIPNIPPGAAMVMKMAGKNGTGTGPQSAPLNFTAPVAAPNSPPTAFTGSVIGMHGGARDIDYRATRSLKPKLVRVGGLSATMTRSQIQAIASEYAKTSTRIIALVDFNEAAPSEAESRNIGTWATIPGLEAIEFGNEPWLQNESWDYAQYARSYKAAYDAVKAANPSMVLIAQGDSANRGHRPGLRVMQEIKNLGIKPKAIQIHPYGPDYLNRLGDARRDLKDVGWSTGVDIWVTEVGVSTDNGRTVYQGGTPNNYGWNAAMTYAEAGKTIDQVTSDLLAQGVTRIIVYMGTDYRAPGTSNEREYYFGLTKTDGGDKGDLSTVMRRLFNR